MSDPYQSFLFLIFAEEPDIQSRRIGLTIPTSSSPVLVEKHHQFGAVCGNDSSFTNKADLSVTKGINSEHKQEPRQSPKDARPARQHR